MKGYRLWIRVACKIIVIKNVSFNEPISSKEGESSQISATNKEKFSLTYVFERKFNYCVINDQTQGVASVQVYQVIEYKN